MTELKVIGIQSLAPGEHWWLRVKDEIKFNDSDPDRLFKPVVCFASLRVLAKGGVEINVIYPLDGFELNELNASLIDGNDWGISSNIEFDLFHESDFIEVGKTLKPDALSRSLD
ncbi:MAG: hypothetical protein HC909_01985 [Blastochloris sp.]|nr:hypothetical protein [Blastochloris sp.]